MRLGEILGLLGGWSVVLIAVSAYVSNLVAQRLQSRWRRQEHSELELLRDQLHQSRLALETAVNRQAAGGDLAQRKRLDAALGLWEAVLVLRDRLDLPLLLCDILLPEEYDHVLKGAGPLSTAARELSDESLQQAVTLVDHVEAKRPLLGDKLWFVFYIYKAVRARATYLLIRGVEQDHVEGWYEDNGLRQLLSYVLSTDRLNEIYGGQRLGSLRRALDDLELEILREIAVVVSCERTSRESYEIAAKLREASVAAQSRA